MPNHHKSSTHGNANGQPAALDAAVRLSTLLAEANGRLIKVQTQATNEALAENVKYINALLNTPATGDYSAMFAGWANLYQANLRRVIDVSRSCLDMVPETQAEIAKLMGEPFGISKKGTH